MKWSINIIFVFTSVFLNGQQTFSKIYDLNSSAIKNYMLDMELYEDKIFVLSFQFCYNDSTYSNCTALSEFDLSGNYQNHIVNDSICFPQSISVMGQSCDDCLTINNSKVYMSTRHCNEQGSTVLYTYDLQLNNEFIKTYEGPNSGSYMVNEGNAILDSSIYIYGNVKNDGNTPDSVQIIKTDLFGNVEWIKYLTLGHINMNINSIQKTPEGQLALILSTGPAPGAGGLLPRQKIQILSIDGDTLNSYIPPYRYEQDQQNRLLVSEDGNFYFLTDNHPIFGHDGISQGRLNRLNESMEVIDWSLRLPNHAILDWRHYRSEDIIQAKNGDIIACGKTFENSDSEIHPNSDFNAVWNGFIIRVSQEGEIIWLRIYKNENDLLPKEEFGRFRPSKLNKVRELEDGRIIAAGNVTVTSSQFLANQNTEIEDNHLWLLMVDEDGCLEGYPCQELIRLDSTFQVDPPHFTIGTKWTYEYFPEPSDSDKIIYSYITYEVADTMTVDEEVIYHITNNRDLSDLQMKQTENEVWFWNESEKLWQMTYDFNAVFSYITQLEDSLEYPVNIDTIIDLPFWFSDRGFQPLQHVSIVYEGDTLATKSILKNCGPIFGGLTFEDHPLIGKIRCFEQGDFYHNFGPIWPFVPCDTMWTDIIDNVVEFEFIPDIYVFPNPTQEEINLNVLPVTIESFQVFSINGELLIEGEHNGSINVSALLQGNYIIVLRDNNSNYKTVRFIKS